MTDHLSPDFVNALVDGELSSDQLAAANEHLAQCTSCTSNALFHYQLKSATAKAGLRYPAPPGLGERLSQLARNQGVAVNSSPSRTRRRAIGSATLSGWAAACALLLIFGGIFVVERHVHQTAIASAQSSALAAEVCDQHIATLATNAPPQVLSSDRHTVKPWFLGKIPFSFNLPEDLPADTRLEGANLTYLHDQPAALLLYSIGKHRVSVFVLQKAGAHNRISEEHAGFRVIALSTADLEMIAVSDVDPLRLSSLVGQLRQAQDGPHQ